MKPALVLGGRDNALSIARSLGARGVPVYLSTDATSDMIGRSRFCSRFFAYPTAEDAIPLWTELLLDQPNGDLDGAVLLGACDEAVEFLARHRETLKQRYTIDLFDSDIQLAMLDKTKTLALAAEHGCAIPGNIDAAPDMTAQQLAADMQFPLLVKPKLSHLFQQAFDGRKFFVAHDESELDRGLERVRQHDIDVMLCELIPGPDSLLCSYYTYMDDSGSPLFHFTKRIFRRFPVGEGGGAYHATEWYPDVADEGLKFFKGIGYKGLGNIEFKRDPRDGKLKVMECNPRFTAAQELLARSGFDVADFVYARLTNGPVPQLDEYQQDLRYWYPIHDFKAFRQLKSRGELTFRQWLKSILTGSKAYPMFRFSDPLPSLIWNCRLLMRSVQEKFGRS